jgi:hypothetical protein
MTSTDVLVPARLKFQQSVQCTPSARIPWIRDVGTLTLVMMRLWHTTSGEAPE